MGLGMGWVYRQGECIRVGGWVRGCRKVHRRGQIEFNTKVKTGLRRWGGWRDLGLRRCMWCECRDLKTSYNPRGCSTPTTASNYGCCAWAWACSSMSTTTPNYECCACSRACSSYWFSLTPIVCLAICYNNTAKLIHSLQDIHDVHMS